MNKIASLIKTDLNITFGLSSLIYNFKNKKNRWPIVLFLVAMVSLIPTYIMVVLGLGKIYEVYKEMGQQSYFLLTGFLIAQVFVFLFGLLYVMSKFYFSNDLAYLVPLPIKASSIIGSKFVSLMVSEYLTSLPIILPFIIIYGIKGGEGILYWIYSLVLITTLPIIPLVLASIIIMIFMKYTNVKGKKDLLRIVGTVLFLVFIIYFQLKMQSIMSKAITQGEDFYLGLVNDSNLLVKKLGYAFPPSMWAALTLGNYSNLSGLFNLSFFVISGLIGFIIVIFLSEKLFFDGLIGNIEVSASKGRSKGNNIKLSFDSKKPYIAIALKEVKMLFKTPIYLMNTIGAVIIMPVLLIMTIKMGDKSLAPIIEMVNSKEYLIPLAGIGFIGFLGMLNSIGCTTFSREGKNFWIQRTLPINASDQIIGRVLSSLVVQLIGLVGILIAFFIIFKINLINILLITFIGLLASIPMTGLGMIIDISRPLLTWDNPQKAIKQNLNVIISLGVGSIYAGGVMFIINSLLGKIDINLVYSILVLIFIVSSLIIFVILKKLITRQFMELE